MAGILSKGITLSYKALEGADYTDLTNLQEIPDIGGESEAIEVTVLSDAAHMYIDGLISYGDSLAFKFLYETAQFEVLAALEGVQAWKVTLPDGATCSFNGGATVKLDGVGINAAMTYTLAIKPNSEMVWG